MVLPVEITSDYGVLGYWSTGVLQKNRHEIQNELVLSLLHYSATPVLPDTVAREKDH